MLQQICTKISETIVSVLKSQTEIEDDTTCNPISYFNAIYRLQSGVLRAIALENTGFEDAFPTALDFTTLENGEQTLFEIGFIRKRLIELIEHAQK